MIFFTFFIILLFAGLLVTVFAITVSPFKHQFVVVVPTSKCQKTYSNYHDYHTCYFKQHLVDKKYWFKFKADKRAEKYRTHMRSIGFSKPVVEVTTYTAYRRELY